MSVFYPLLLASWLTVGAAPPPEEQAAYQTVKSDYQAGNFAKAAPGFEALWQAFNNPKYLHYAGIAWAAAGRDTHAIYCWRQVLKASTATAKQREDAGRFLVEAYSRTRRVSVAVEPRSDHDIETGAMVSLKVVGANIDPITRPMEAFVDETPGSYVVFLTHQRWSLTVPGTQAYESATTEIGTQTTQVTLDRQPKPGQVHLHVTLPRGFQTVGSQLVSSGDETRTVGHQLHSGDQNLELPPGTYELRIDQPGLVAYTRQLIVHPGQTTPLKLEIEALAATARHPPSQPQQKLALGLGIASAITTVGGGVFIAVGESPPANQDPRYHAQFAAIGGVATGAGVGLATEALLTQFTENRPKRLFTSLGLGLAAVVGGVAWFAYGFSRVKDDFHHETPSAPIYGSSLVLGVGTGLTSGSLSGLLLKKFTRRSRRASLSLLPISLRIRF